MLLPHGANTAMAVPAGRQGKKTNVVVRSSRPWNIFSVDQLRLFLAASVSEMLLTISFVSLSFLVVPVLVPFPREQNQPTCEWRHLSLSTGGSDSLPGLVRAAARPGSPSPPRLSNLFMNRPESGPPKRKRRVPCLLAPAGKDHRPALPSREEREGPTAESALPVPLATHDAAAGGVAKVHAVSPPPGCPGGPVGTTVPLSRRVAFPPQTLLRRFRRPNRTVPALLQYNSYNSVPVIAQSSVADPWLGGGRLILSRVTDREARIVSLSMDTKLISRWSSDKSKERHGCSAGPLPYPGVAVRNEWLVGGHGGGVWASSLVMLTCCLSASWI